MSKTPPNEYVTRQGDMWDSIAYRLFGTSGQTHELIKANPEYINTYIFESGITLRVPELKSVIDTSMYPPWKR